jgi:hypothetical protein
VDKNPLIEKVKNPYGSGKPPLKLKLLNKRKKPLQGKISREKHLRVR